MLLNNFFLNTCGYPLIPINIKKISNHMYNKYLYIYINIIQDNIYHTGKIRKNCYIYPTHPLDMSYHNNISMHSHEAAFLSHAAA